MNDAPRFRVFLAAWLVYKAFRVLGANKKYAWELAANVKMPPRHAMEYDL